ncbi:MAG: hypothetical protein KatS3mg068_0510 [Candidatus Sericytochromatia bacterium]|nr:MAG: hypothetical protein KatS3mg068_0510 [Candidatus Sericytochromatia bacterium]
MKKNFLKILSPLLFFSYFSCVNSPTNPPSYSDIAIPKATPSALPYSSILDNLKPGTLPGSVTSPEEQQLIDLMNRKVNLTFPLKLGVLLLQENIDSIDNLKRKELLSKYIEHLKSNNNISDVIEIPSSLISRTSTIEDIRKLAARFQVNLLIIINDTYESPYNDKEKDLTPLEIISNINYFKTKSNMEVFVIDIVSGVFVLSQNISNSLEEKISLVEDYKIKNLLNKSIDKLWNDLKDFSSNKINELANKR